MQETWIQSLSHEGPLEEEMATHPVLLPGKPMDGGAWRATVLGATKSQTRLSPHTHGLHTTGLSQSRR